MFTNYGDRLSTDGMVQNGTGVLYEMVWSVLARDAQFYRIPVFPTLYKSCCTIAVMVTYSRRYRGR
jgi:hypothetical protein